MARSWRGVIFAASSCLLAVSLLSAATRAEEKAADLPLKRVVLFNSGLGFFEHNGTVEGNAQAELRFNVADINDLLKSLVVEDLGGGQISTVGYGSKDPISKTLSSFAIDLTTNPTLGDLLGQIRGERVELEAPDKITGLIVGVEKKSRKVGDDEVIQIDVLNLLTDEGLRAVPLESVARIQLLDEKLNAELHKALSLLASAHATDKKAVTLQFRGEGQRPVRVGYIQETPVWKTSYRLVLDEKKAPFLQGWAIVENTTEADWNDVNLTLVSGRPVSFTMDLYQPLYVPRPQEQLELYASLRPERYDQNMLAETLDLAVQTSSGAAPAPAAEPPAEAEEEKLTKRIAGPARKPAGGDTWGRAAGRQEQAERGAFFDSTRKAKEMATAGEVGELFQYNIAMPVTLPRQQSAMLPIVNQEVKGEKLSIYNQNVHAKHPLNGLRLTNSTALHLMQGPITVFDGSVYAGDAIINDLPPGSQRLLSYAMDLETEVAPETKGETGQLVSVKLTKGTAIVTHKQNRTIEYTVKNSGKEAKTVLIEYPVRPEWTLIEPKEPTEKTREEYRFAVEAKPGEPAKLTVTEEHLQGQQMALNNLDDNTIQYYVSAPSISAKVKDALGEIVQRKQALEQVIEQRKQLEEQTKAIDQEQARIRQNMDRLDRNSELYKRYVKKFSDQEDQIEKLRTQIQELGAKEQELRKAMDEFLVNLEVE